MDIYMIRDATTKQWFSRIANLGLNSWGAQEYATIWTDLDKAKHAIEALCIIAKENHIEPEIITFRALETKTVAIAATRENGAVVYFEGKRLISFHAIEGDIIRALTEVFSALGFAVSLYKSLEILPKGIHTNTPEDTS